MLLVDRDNRILFELYHTCWQTASGPPHWEAGSGAIYQLDGNGRRPEGWTSADAAGLAILPGLVRYDEVFGSGPIRHAFRVTVQYTNGHVYPASHTASNSTSPVVAPCKTGERPGGGKVPGIRAASHQATTFPA